MNTIFATIGIVLQLLPAIIVAMKAIEEAIPGEGKGEQKLAAVREIMETVHGSAVPLWPTIEKVIGVLVKTFNATGTFQKG